MSRYTEEMKLWLFDLAHGNLNDNDILIGFIKHYVLSGYTVSDIQRDIVYHTIYGIDNTIQAVESVNRVLTAIAEGKADH